MNKITQEEYINALETIKKFKCQCSKCGKQFSNRWEWSANSFFLRLNIDCQSTVALFGDKSNEIGFNHPAILPDAGFQSLSIESGKEKEYRLCPSCHREFVGLIGDFLIKSL